MWASVEINSLKHSGNVAFTPFSPGETLQENIKQRNSHILHFCSQEDLKALHEQLTNPSAFSSLPVLVLMKRHRHREHLPLSTKKMSLLHLIVSSSSELHRCFPPNSKELGLPEQGATRTLFRMKANKYQNNNS